MKKMIVTAALLACSFALFTSCQKETRADENAPVRRLMLVTEGFDSDEAPTKTSVSGNDVAWIGDGSEMVAINNRDFDKAVTIDEGKAYINATPEYPIYGYYGLGLYSVDNVKTTTPKVSIPCVYNSTFQAGRQVITLPMVAYSTTEGEKIQFYHVTAAVNVKLKNTTGSALKLSHIVVSSATTGLASAYNNSDYHRKTITLHDNAAPEVEVSPISDDYSGSVTVICGGQEIPVYSSDSDILDVQVPVLPIDAGDLTIDVYAFKEGNAASSIAGVRSGKNNTVYHFSATAAAPALARNQMMTAKIQLQNSTAHEVVDNRVFTINAGGDKVRFSQGNLVYSNHTWYFHTNQYDRCFNYSASDTNISKSISETGTLDLFGWGTSGYHNPDDSQNANYNPWSSDHRNIWGENNPYGYGPSYNMTDKDLTGTSANYDWGVYNAISNGGNAAGLWRTLTKDEWQYLAQTRSAFPIKNQPQARYTVAKINTDATPVLGIILFPDNYVGGTPEGVVWGEINLDVYVSSVATLCTTAGWNALQDAGCVFLPKTGYRSSGYLRESTDSQVNIRYWTASAYNENVAYAFGTESGTFHFKCVWTNFITRCVGHAVRLVRDVE